MTEAAGTAAAVCVDACVAAKWFLRDEQDDLAALALLERSALGQLELLVPDLFFHEMGSVFLRALRRGRLTESLVLQHLTALEELQLNVEPVRGEMDAALYLGRQLGVSYYDAAYLALAESRGVPLVTSDQKLIEASSGHLDWVLTPAAALERI